MQNLRRIVEHNARNDVSYTLGLNGECINCCLYGSTTCMAVPPVQGKTALLPSKALDIWVAVLTFR